MYINDIKLDNFRNIKNNIFYPSPNINLLFGNNAAGKTSFIEAIFSLSNLKSFRTSYLFETINKTKNKSYIECNYTKNNCIENIKIEINKKNKIFFKNDKSVKIDEYLCSIFSIDFKPDDINIISGPPIKRRELIDKAIFYTDKEYFKILKQYFKIIENKNKLLKTENLKNLEEWNILISKYSSIIDKKRSDYIYRLNKILINLPFKFRINYLDSEKIENKENYYLKKINENIDKEIKYKYSIIGCHKNKVNFFYEDNDLNIYGSQGQKRSFIILFRTAQIIDFEYINKFKPILLLDDIASELDINNKNILFNLIENHSGQTFITTTDKNLFLSKSRKLSKFYVKDGTISSFS
ncbi:DNA replication/repair protein RecF [Geopsychrobacter electrodiphilus]|uniref:DNA replication/repair protein RecF n=1 Tax=Geopsychrobacter electrodiphilus TaxID=225196 RepID=UPI000378A695|nr:DNA replication and repair protein RecF [Geopsychrobacter electrodiphilus]